MDRKNKLDKKTDRKKVAVFTANIYRDMVKDTQYGLIQAAKRELLEETGCVAKKDLIPYFPTRNHNYQEYPVWKHCLPTDHHRS